MVKQELTKLTKEYAKVFKEYHDYMNQFFTSWIDGVEVKKATKIFTLEEFEKTKKMRNEFEKIQKEWFEAVRSGKIEA